MNRDINILIQPQQSNVKTCFCMIPKCLLSERMEDRIFNTDLQPAEKEKKKV